MTQKRHGTKSASKSSQSTLSFNGRSSKVTKPIGSHAGKDVLSHTEDVDTENLEKRLKPKSNTKPLKLLNRETQEAVSSKSDSPEPESKSEKIAEPENAEEALARKITDREIVAYWQKKESERRAPRVHQADLNVHEKILREWDMSGQYGSCMGISRPNRWHRAHSLDLKPPLVVLAVLQRQQEEGNARAKRAYVDELMRSRFVET